MTKGREIALALWVLLGVGVSGVLLGLAWYAFAPTLPVEKVERGFVYTENYPEQPVAADGWFVLLLFGFGVLASVTVWLLVRNARGPLQMIALTFGAIIAAVLAWKVGSTIGKSDYEERKKTAVVGEILQKPIDLTASGRIKLPLLGQTPIKNGETYVGALGVLLTYALLAGWSARPGLRPGEPDDDFTDLWHEAGQPQDERPQDERQDGSVELGSGAELPEVRRDGVDLPEQSGLPGKQP